MRPTLFVFVLLTIVIYQCAQRQAENTALITAKRDSLKVYDTLRSFNLPLQLNTKQWKALTKSDNGESGIPFAQVPLNKRYKGVIFLVDYLPVLVTMDTADAAVDTLFLFDDRGNDLKADVSEFARINPDLSVLLTDSIYSFQLDKAGNRINGSEKFERVEEHYRITENGVLNKVN